MSASRTIAVVETEEFLADVPRVLSEDEHDALILYVAQQPEAGVLDGDLRGKRADRFVGDPADGRRLATAQCATGARLGEW